MLKKFLKFRVVLGVFLVFALLYSSDIFAFSRGNGRHYYTRGSWYRQRWFWFDAIVPTLAIGAIVRTLPLGYTTVIVRGHQYYYYNNVYFQTYNNNGFLVVEAPSIVIPVTPKPAEPIATAQVTIQKDVYTINIPNSKGGYTAVIIKKVKEGFTGPQGELYKEFPTVEQLKVLYGTKK
ncbi:MAG: hypothetical protein A2452_00765 [Candidatus Firestonebacteria bacterium RIFOXYC2_FULL_39_67]|nr:MAG: hypothetical protein A2536_06315 [Candidatus Firestonebacteria bacterium RIFOXYD2_FULL_39_29]OGF56084.1 MAG: hypothetical protein A2452_00765 [Candidatus Firestonebacteria bacterium RIFOXYC2_FULL_39_67]OGF56465.1 MAG: hypothetical protein A2497_08260 [Candidatus Firestonebacteria bacterium RifOxyC12_full_39_7]